MENGKEVGGGLENRESGCWVDWNSFKLDSTWPQHKLLHLGYSTFQPPSVCELLSPHKLLHFIISVCKVYPSHYFISSCISLYPHSDKQNDRHPLWFLHLCHRVIAFSLSSLTQCARESWTGVTVVIRLTLLHGNQPHWHIERGEGSGVR